MMASVASIELPPLDLAMLCARMAGPTRAALAGMEVLERADSTNTRVMEAGHVPDGRFRVCLAEEQTAGRGRRGRTWVSPRGASLYLSLGIGLAPGECASQVLPLGLGVAVAETLRRYGSEGIGLKWPNDLYADGAKLGGILVESHRAGHGPGILVAGLGLNLRWTQAQGAAIDQAWTDLSRVTPGGLPDRHDLAAGLIEALWGNLGRSVTDGVDDLQGRYAALDILRGREVAVQTPDGRFVGHAQGIGPDGALRVRVDGLVCELTSAEASVRLLK
jgi:BirA family biotin operon repressor/biotin-[acetyl-CoA-carboxylase] ligase